MTRKVSHRGMILFDPVIASVAVPDSMRWFRLEEEMLNLGLGEREAVAITREAMEPEMTVEVRFLHLSWRRHGTRGMI